MIYNRVLENIILPAGDLVIGTDFMTELRKWRHISWKTSDQLRNIQRKALQNQLHYCKTRIPFYKKLNLPNIDDPYELIKHFPIVDKQTIKSNLASLVVKSNSRLVKESSSGSSGIQGTVYMTKREESVNRAIQVLWWEWAGYKLGDKIIQTGMTYKRNYEKQLKDILLKTDYYIAFGLDEKKVRNVLEKQISNPRKMLLGYASSLYLFAKIAAELNINNVRFEGVVSWGDKMFDHYKRLIESQFQTQVFDTYACTEGFMIAAQCDRGSYHMMSPQTYLEILDENNNEIEDGKLGRVVVTRLDNRAMPLVRYSLGDLAVKEKQDVTCDCGRGLPLLNNIIGRDTDIIKTASGKYLIVHFFTAIFEHIPEIKQFRVIQRSINGIEIEFIKGNNFEENVLDFISHEIFKHLDEKIEIKYTEVSNIPSSPSGKPQMVRSLLNDNVKRTPLVIREDDIISHKKGSSFFEFALKVKGFPFQEASQQLEALHKLSPEEFNEWQNNKKWNIVKHHFENNDFYRNKIGDSIPTCWKELPILTKNDYQISGKNLHSRNVKPKDLYTGYTSGSSGHPFRYAKDKFSHAMTWALIKDRYRQFDLTLDSKQARFYGIPFEKIDYAIEKAKDFVSNRVRFPVFDLSDDVLSTFLDRFETTKFEFIYGYTNSIVLFARYLIKRKILLRTICPTLKVCIGTSENCTEEDKKIMTQAFGVPAINEYGTSEVDIIAIEDNLGNWKISEENIFIEVLDNDGNDLTTGGEGRIVLTALHNKIMPFIRYEIGDKAIIEPGSERIVINKLLGGVNDIVILPSGRKSPGITFYFITRSILENMGSLKEFIIKQTEVDKFVFEVVSDVEISEREKFLIQKNMDIYLEPGLTFEIQRVPKIERTKAGKMKHFHSYLNKN